MATKAISLRKNAGSAGLKGKKMAAQSRLYKPGWRAFSAVLGMEMKRRSFLAGAVHILWQVRARDGWFLGEMVQSGVGETTTAARS
jgi:hypothetical protein